MQVENAVRAERDQSRAFFADLEDGPIIMVNLLKFRPFARYADGAESDLPGAAAYGRYAEAVTRLIVGLGGRLLSGGEVTGLLIGQVEALWDKVLLVEYPSTAAFREMLASPQMRAIEHHREAGLDGQLNIRIRPRP